MRILKFILWLPLSLLICLFLLPTVIVDMAYTFAIGNEEELE